MEQAAGAYRRRAQTAGADWHCQERQDEARYQRHHDGDPELAKQCG